MVHSSLVHFLEICAISTHVLSSFFFYILALIISHPVADISSLSSFMSFLLQFATSSAKTMKSDGNNTS